MKRFIRILTVFTLSSLAVASAFAGGVDNKTNNSAEYARTGARNAATDYADAAIYNPAGTTLLKDGFYINGSIQYLDKSYTNTIGGTDYESDTPSVIPSFIALYKKDNWSAYFAGSNYGGGGKVEYDNGNAMTVGFSPLLLQGANGNTFPVVNALLPQLVIDEGWNAGTGFYDAVSAQKLEADSMYIGLTVGGAYKINDMFSASLGLRYIKANTAAKVSVTLAPNAAINAAIAAEGNPLLPGLPSQTINVDYEDTANGVGAILGLNIRPNDQWNIGIRYETATALEFERDTDTDDTGMFPDGTKRDRDLPAILAAGVSYMINDKLRTEVDLTLYLNDRADWDGAEDHVSTGYDAGFVVEYAFTPTVKGSFGYLRTDSGIDADYTETSAPRLNADTFSGGVAWAISDRFDLNAGISKVLYEDATTTSGVTLDSDVLILACGLQYRFF
jgi:long-chain fatty acid transport protein